jgi:NifU-like protein involved in Fe-S cluster formation
MWLESMVVALDDLEPTGLGAPSNAADWVSGSAGRIEDDCQVVCWLRSSRGVIRAARFEVFAGADALSAAEWLARWLEGRDNRDARAVTGYWLAQSTAMDAESRAEALCLEDALQAALAALPDEGGGRSS